MSQVLSPWTGRYRLAVIMAFLITVVVVMVPFSAVASDEERQYVSVSLDGVTFESAPGRVLFDPAFRIVPGDFVTEPVWVRNDGPSSARLHVEFAPSNVTDADFGRELTVQPERLSTAGDVWRTSINDAGTCTVILQNAVIEPGEIATFDLTATLGNLDGLAGQSGSADVRFTAVLTDAAMPTPANPRVCVAMQPTPSPTPSPTTPGPTPTTSPTPTETPSAGPGVPGDADADGGLSITGAAFTAGFFVMLFGLIAGGFGLILAGKRRRASDG